MRYLLLFLCLYLAAGCTQEEASPVSETATDPVKDPNNSVQAAADAARAREAMPGRVHYQQVCASCHDGQVKKAPHRDMIGLMTPESILATISTGIMKDEAATLDQAAKEQVAEYLAGTTLGEMVPNLPSCGSVGSLDIQEQKQHNWGIEATNTRAISLEVAGLSTANIAELKPKWAIAFPGATRVRSQPTIAAGRVFVGSHGGKVYALDPETGCVHWAYQAAAEVRTAITVDTTGEEPMIFFGDVLANAYGIAAESGRQIWRIRADEHPNATITGSPTLHEDTLYIPVSSLEVSLAVNPKYECCTFRGSVLAVDKYTGEQRWKTYTIAEEPAVTGQNPIGTNIIGPSGAVVWNSPSIDVEHNQLYVGTGENMSSPATLTSDAMIAMDLTTGKTNWVFQATANDVWNTACDTDTPENCPVEDGPDFDFGGATIVVDTTRHGRLVIAGQKSGLVHALDPKDGSLVWQTRVGRGGIQGGIHFGIAASGETLLVPISDMADGRSYPTPDRPGMHALDANTGEILWSTLHEDRCGDRQFCHPGISQVVTVIGDLVIGGAMDGMVRAYSIDTGEIRWEIDTTAEFNSTLRSKTRGGSLGGGAGPVAKDGLLLLSSGYGIYLHMPGNLLLALEVD